MEKRVEEAIQAADYGTLSSILESSVSGSQGEQRSLAATLIKAAVSSSTFLPKAFSYPNTLLLLKRALINLPSSVENAADNTLREMLFEFHIGEEEYREAASILMNKRMEDMDEGSVYYTPSHVKCDVFVRIAECYLEGDEIVEAEGAVNKAGSALEQVTDTETHLALILRYKATYARVLDANRKFLQAANRYYDLSKAGSHTDIIADDDLLIMLGRACTCAILSPSGPQRQRLFDSIYHDERLSQLDSLSSFQCHSIIIAKMYNNEIIQRDVNLTTFENSLEDHHKALMSDGLTIVQRTMIDHNITAISSLYANIYFTDLGLKIGVSAEAAEQVAAKMISNGTLLASIDQIEGLLKFEYEQSPEIIQNDAIMNFCVNLNCVTEKVQRALMANIPTTGGI